MLEKADVSRCAGGGSQALSKGGEVAGLVARVDVSPDLLEWAETRSGLAADVLRRKVPQLDAWYTGAKSPTFRQLENFAHATYTPIGSFFLSEPPEDELPVTDFRTIRNNPVSTPSPHLLDTIALCEQRQEWYRQHAINNGEVPLRFVRSLTPGEDGVAQAANAIRVELGFTMESRRRFSTWTDALTGLIDAAEAVGVLVMVSGVVGSNTSRVLDVDEFRGFALVDDYAPVIFINGVDTKAAQIFTLAHELAHVWIGESGVSNVTAGRVSSENEVELWCNQVAAELLVPLQNIRADFRPATEIPGELNRLARIYKVSTLVVLRRVYDAGFLSWDRFRLAWESELERVLALGGQRSPGGGNYYNTQPRRVSKRFARALIASTLEGRTLYRDAFQMIGSGKMSTFEGLGERLGVI